MRFSQGLSAALAAALLAGALAAVPFAEAAEFEGKLPGRGRLYASGTPLKKQCAKPPAAPRPVCIHWATKGREASTSGWVQAVRSVVNKVWAVQIGQLGFRPPRSDKSSTPRLNPNGGFDIYLRDMGARGSFGSCATDDPKRKTSRQVSAYCALDNDYASTQYSDVNGVDALKVTAAHEIFHAVQFAYNHKAVKRDPWLSEGTATMIEDEVFDDINANYVYLWDSQLQQPEIPLDAFGTAGGAWADLSGSQNFEYGAWLFWRFLSEYTEEPAVIREVWEKIGSGQSPVEAVGSVLTARGDNFTNAFSWFGLVGSAPDWFYEEGSGYVDEMRGHYGPWDGTHHLGPDRPISGSRSLTVDHLSNRSVRFYPLTVPNALKLTVNVDLPSGDVFGARIVVIYETCQFSHVVPLNSQGDGTLTVPVGFADCFEGVPEQVFTAFVTLTNASMQDGQPVTYTWSVN